MTEVSVKFCLGCIIVGILFGISILLLFNIYYTQLPAQDKLLRLCNNYYISSIKINKNKYEFIGVEGCDQKNNIQCSYSITQNINPFYFQKNSIDNETQDFLNSFDFDKIFYVENVQELAPLYPSINIILQNTIVKINKAWFVKIKTNNDNYQINIVTNSSSNKSFCPIKIIKKTLTTMKI